MLRSTTNIRVYLKEKVRVISCRQYAAQLEGKWTSASWRNIQKASKNADLAISHFDNFYSKVYGPMWPSMRLGLLSPHKYCAISNSFLDNEELYEELRGDSEIINLDQYYKKHLRSWTHHKIREELLENKKARRREMMAKEAGVDASEIDATKIEVSDISDGQLTDGNTTSGGFASPAEDLLEMFSDRKLDDDEKFFINRASTSLSLNDYVPADEIISQEDLPINDLSYFESYRENDDDFPVNFTDGAPLVFSDQLKIYTRKRNDWTNFEDPGIHKESGLSKYYFLDGASILPVLALDLQHNESCADYCASPGGKSLAIMMTLKPSNLLCNDISVSRLKRLRDVFDHFCPKIKYVNETLKFSNQDARSLIHSDTYDKILVDAPCTNDRHSAQSSYNNIFKLSRTEERVALPYLQRDILVAALSSVKPKGNVVYSTCSMSPIQNDGVVHAALREMYLNGHQSKFTIVNLKETFRPLRGLYKFYTQFKYGQQVVPNVCSNFGPMYISKIKRES